MFQPDTKCPVCGCQNIAHDHYGRPYYTRGKLQGKLHECDSETMKLIRAGWTTKRIVDMEYRFNNMHPSSYLI